MPDGVGPGLGWEVLINGQFRVFLDRFTCAHEVAMRSKAKQPADLVQIRGYETDDVRNVLEDGRLG